MTTVTIALMPAVLVTPGRGGEELARPSTPRMRA
jgi:hypothetical protein